METGDDATRDEGFAALYEQLRIKARHALSTERADHTLTPTALVHEVYLRLGPDGDGTFQGRAHFLATASAVMRRVLVDHARARGRLKRGGGWTRVNFDESLVLAEEDLDRVLTLDEMLDRLAEIDDDAAMIVQMRFFAAMTEDQIAEEMGRSPRWVRKHWAFARGWLQAELADDEGLV